MVLEAATAIAKEIGGEVLLIDPLSPDWMNNLRHVAQSFRQVLSRNVEPPDHTTRNIRDRFSVLSPPQLSEEKWDL